MEDILILHLSVLASREAADVSRRPMINAADGGIEAPDTAEAGSKGNLGHGQGGLVNEFFREMQTAGLGDSAGRCSQVPHKETPKMTRANSKMLRETLDAIFQSALAN
jgi:hypothetical protein